MEHKKLGRYELRSVLGKGAMGVVYEGFDPSLGRRVAVKTILKSVGLDAETEAAYAARFIQEAKAVARLNHANIVQVYDFSVESDIAYLVMEFIQGRELRSFFSAGERFEPGEAVRVMGELLDALHFAHEAGVIHRDIKPANVMLDAQRRVKLADFGVARIQDSERSAAGTMVGTPAFMSPEQISGGKIDRRTDIFSAGTILYQLLTGEQPFKGEGAWTVAKQIMQDDPPRPSSVVQSVSPVFDGIVNKALAKKPAERFANAQEFATALRAALAPGAQATTVVAPKPKARVEAKASEAEVEFWRGLLNSTDADEFEFYLEQFPEGTYASLARHKIAKLREPQEAARRAAEEKARQEAEEQARREAEQRAAQEAQARARREAEERAALEAQARAKREAEERAARETQERAKREAEEQAKRAAAEKAKREAEERAKREAEEKAKREAEEKARRAQALAKLKQQGQAAARAKPGIDEDATVAIGQPARPAEPPAQARRSFVIPVAVGAVVVFGAVGVAAYLMSSRSSPPAAVAQAPAVQKAATPAPVPPAPAKPAVPAAEIEKIKQETEERIRREFAEKAAAEQAAAVKAVAEKALKEKQLAAKAAAEKAAADKIAAATLAQERAAMEKALAEKAAAAKLAAAKAAADKAAADKAAAEKAAAENAAAEKTAAAKAQQQAVASAAPAVQGLVPGHYVFRLTRGTCGYVNISEDIEFRSSSQGISGTKISDLRLKSESDGSVTGSVFDNSQRFGVGEVKLEGGRPTAIGFAGTYNARYGQWNQPCSGPWSLWRTTN